MVLGNLKPKARNWDLEEKKLEEGRGPMEG
jgi:hypothetical protein